MTVRDVTKTIDDWGEATESTTDYTVKGHVQILSSEDESVKAGILKVGDLIAFFDRNATNISYVKRGNKIYYDSEWYKINEVIKEPTLNGQGHYEVHARRI